MKRALASDEMEALADLVAALAVAARQHDVPVDEEVYSQAGRPPWEPIVCAGDPAARVCCLGRDLGRAEVLLGEPLIGPAGRRVRAGVLRAVGERPSLDEDDPQLRRALRHVFLANAVPYKPPENRGYPRDIIEAFRPHLARLLAYYWQGDIVFALGVEAFHWFAPYRQNGVRDESSWEQRCRRGRPWRCRLLDGRAVVVYALPHPSPANARWAQRFPALLARRWAQALVTSDTIAALAAEHAGFPA